MYLWIPDKADTGIDLDFIGPLMAPFATAFGEWTFKFRRDILRGIVILSRKATISGIWFVGNIGRERGSIVWPLMVIYGLKIFDLITGISVSGFTSFLGEQPINAFTIFEIKYSKCSTLLFSGVIAFNWKSKEWRRQIRESAPLWKRCLILFLCGKFKRNIFRDFLYFLGNLKYFGCF